ncbi:ABC-type Fe3+-hydroxamate transport system substrate-binding protein [Paenibacillus sp. W4I10]|uniref:hypothetical protein n=1 Tax=Paenibacillus sp. W4I10 TaxID=3042298 RepID=UPI00277E0991|nr:hypothetical protein [Paenibacillus sp. W4I10]MDQ0720033.1 ABC-type Fe3+-hydroxamate transport system substrate-binding protein [Paenibacillus sp. W4I10]
MNCHKQHYDWRERLTFLAYTFGEESKKDEYLAKYDAKSAEWKQKLEAAVHGESFAVIETYPNNLVIYSNKGAAEMLYGEWGLKSLMSIITIIRTQLWGECSLWTAWVR